MKHIAQIFNSVSKIRNLKRERGFTIVELLIYMGILSILLIVLTGVFTSIIDAQFESEATSVVQQDGRFLMSRLIYDIQRANNIITPALGQQDSSLQLSINGINFLYSISGNNLEIIENSVVSKLNGYYTHVKNFQVQRLGNDGGKHSIRVSYTVESTTLKRSGVETQNFSTTVALR